MPSLILDIAANIASLQRDMAQAQRTVNAFAKSTESAFRSLSTIAGAAGISMGMRETITAFMDAEKASMKMAVAMKNQGDYTRDALKDMQDFSKSVQELTAFEDDATLALMANLKTYGMTNEEVKKATKAVLDLTAAKQDEGVSVERASEMIGRAYMGQTQSLKRIGIIIDETKPKAEAFDQVMEQISGRFGGAAAAELETYAGQWKQIKNIMGDVSETIGHVLLKGIEGVVAGLNYMSAGFYSVLAGATKLGAWAYDKVGLTGLADQAKLASQEYESFATIAEKTGDKYAEMFMNFEGGVNKAVAAMKEGSRTLAPLNEKDVKKWTSELEKQIKAVEKFDMEYARIMMTETDFMVHQLEERLKEYEKYVLDQVKLEEMRAKEMEQIRLREKNKLVGIYEELYKATGNQRYRELLLNLMEEILDSEEQKWQDVLKNDEDAYILRMKRDKEYYDHLDGLIDKRVTHEKEAIESVGGYINKFMTLQGNAPYFSESMPESAMAQGGTLFGGISGMPLVPGFEAFYDLVSGRTAQRQLQQQELARQLAEEQKKLIEEQVEAQNRFQEEQVELMKDQLEATKKLAASMGESSEEITDWVSDLTRSTLSPVQGGGSWGIEYTRLKGIAGAVEGTTEDVMKYLSYAKEYLEYAKGDMTSGSYKSIYDMIVGDVQKFQQIYNLGDMLADAGFGATEQEIRKLIVALGNLTFTLDTTETPFGNVQRAINVFTDTGLGSIDDTLTALATKLGIAFTPGIGDAAGSAMVAQYTNAQWQVITKHVDAYVDKVFKGNYYVPGSGFVDQYEYVNVPAQDQIFKFNPISGEMIRMAREGALTSGLTLAGEAGPEWVVPTYEPQRSKFLQDVGADPDAIGRAVAKYIAGGQDISIQIDGREIASVIARQVRGNSDLKESIRRAMN